VRSSFFSFNSVIDQPSFVCFACRLDRRGWTVASVPRDGADGGNANGGGGKVVMIKSKTKRMMDQERYLDATQRCVGPPIYLSLFFLLCAPLVSRVCRPRFLILFLFLVAFIDSFCFFLVKYRGVMRAVQASTFGAPTSNEVGRQSPSLVVEGPRVGAGSGLSPRALYRLLPQRSEREAGGGAASGGAGGASDSGSDTAAASVDGSVAGTGTSWSQEYQYQHLRDHPHVQQVRRWGHSLRGHMESLLAD
jgi:hypothetical protein